jgi:hypothetical protein
MLTVSSSATESIGSGDTGRNLERKMKNQGINQNTAHRTSWVTGMGPVGVSGFASLSKGRPTVKKLLGMLLIGALVSLGCNKTGTTKATEKETKAGGTGAGATVTPTKSAAAPATSGAAHEKETKAAGKSTKAGETKSK